jgi:hypothetical protein
VTDWKGLGECVCRGLCGDGPAAGCRGAARHLHGTCTAPTRHLHGTCTAPARHLHGTYTAPARHLHGTYTAPARHLHGTCTAPRLHWWRTARVAAQWLPMPRPSHRTPHRDRTVTAP